MRKKYHTTYYEENKIKRKEKRLLDDKSIQRKFIADLKIELLAKKILDFIFRKGNV